jgi:transcriptional regulator with XRE-family HTH domain
MSDLAAIKAAIKAELRADGCTQADLAAHLGLSQKHVSQILTGRVQGSHAVIEAMARAVGLSLRIVAGES